MVSRKPEIPLQEDIEASINRRLSRRRKVRLRLAKKRRGVRPDELVFLSTANVAQYWWCAYKALRKSVENENIFFDVFLDDRLLYAHQLGLIDRLPSGDEALLEV